MTKVYRISVENMGDNENIPDHPSGRGKKKWKIIAGGILGAFFLAVAVLAIANRPVLELVLSPENIVMAGIEESIDTLKQLENVGIVKNLEISSETGGVSFFNADESIRVAGEYDDGRLRRVSGEIDTRRVRVATIDEGTELARVMLSPYFGDAEIAAILVRYSPGIISSLSGTSGAVNMSLDIGGNYHVTITGSTRGVVDFNIIPKQ